MKIIQESSKLFLKIIGKQSLQKSSNYRLLFFCIIKSYKDHILIFNNLTKEFISISDEEKMMLENINSYIKDNFIETLIEKWFLVPEDFDDVNFCQQTISLSRTLNTNKTMNNYIILPTTACNARCFYCFEAGAKVATMSEKTSADVVNFIVANSSDNVNLSWFGGEPLCNVQAIDSICNGLKEKNINFKSKIVTNGYLFDQLTIKKAIKNWNLLHAQITLDGTEDKYNRIKNYIYNNTNPFKIVINNIGELLNNGIRVSIRLNMDKHNAGNLFELVNYLHEKFNNAKGLSIYPRLLYENAKSNGIIRSTNERKEITEIYFLLRQHIKELGYLNKNERLKNTIKSYYCMADNPNSIMILPEGQTGYCEHFIDSNYISDIYSDKQYKGTFKYRIPQNDCYKCPCYPDCIMIDDCPSANSMCYEYEKNERIMYLEEINHFENYIE